MNGVIQEKTYLPQSGTPVQLVPSSTISLSSQPKQQSLNFSP